jgi:hypothetical protein
MNIDTRVLDQVFGPDSKGTSALERASSSKNLFVRSQHQLTPLVEGASGRQLSAREALEIFGWDTLKELADRPAVPVVEKPGEPYETIERRVEALNVDLAVVVKRAKWSEKSVSAFKSRHQVPFRDLERVAQLLALDEHALGNPKASGDDTLGVRLRELKRGDAVHFTQPVVLGLAEAAWVVRKQLDIGAMIGMSQKDHLQKVGFTHSSDYGNYMSPAWKKGYLLANEARRLLQLPPDRPIDSLKELIERQLRIPVVQTELPSHFAGATIGNGGSRGIVVNLKGLNESVWVRRMTMAHELGHLLWDSDEVLRRLIVDEYSIVESSAEKKLAYEQIRFRPDYVEMRANGFAIEFLAPRETLVREFVAGGETAESLRAIIIKFGISKTAAINHIQNATNKDLSLFSGKVSAEPGDSWIAREQLAVDYFDPPSVPISRRGLFAAYIAIATDQKLISKDSAASLLACDPREIDRALRSIRELIA